MSNLNDLPWSSIPEHSRDGLMLYFEQGVPLGGFLSSLISNDLKETCARADDINRYRIFDYVQFLYCYAPAPAWGTPEAYEGWIKRGGLKGKQPA